MKKWSVFLLAIWLIATGAIQLINISFSYKGTIMAFLAIASGALLIIAARAKKVFNPTGVVLLGIWLLVSGGMVLMKLYYSWLVTAMAILEVAAGFMLPLGKKWTRLISHPGTILLAVWLVLNGLMSLFGFGFPSSHIFLPVLAILSGLIFFTKG